MRITAFRTSFNSVRWQKSCNNSCAARISFIITKVFLHKYAWYVMRWIFALVEIFGYKMAFWRCYNLIYYLIYWRPPPHRRWLYSHAHNQYTRAHTCTAHTYGSTTFTCTARHSVVHKYEMKYKFGRVDAARLADWCTSTYRQERDERFKSKYSRTFGPSFASRCAFYNTLHMVGSGTLIQSTHTVAPAMTATAAAAAASIHDCKATIKWNARHFSRTRTKLWRTSYVCTHNIHATEQRAEQNGAEIGQPTTRAKCNMYNNQREKNTNAMACVCICANE